MKVICTLKRTAAVAVAVLMVAGTAIAEDVAVQNESFSVNLPAGYGEFAKQVQKTKSADGEIETTNWVSKAPTGEAVIVTMSKMPGKILDPQKMIASTQAGLMKSVGGTVENTEAADDASNVTFRSAGAVFRARLLVRDDSLYQLLYVGRSDEQRNAPAVGTMFETFKLAAPAAAATPAAPAAAPAPAAQ